MKNRIVAMLMTVLMAIAFMPAMAFADGAILSTSGQGSSTLNDEAITEKKIEALKGLQAFLRAIELEKTADQAVKLKDTLDKAYGYYAGAVLLASEGVEVEQVMPALSLLSEKLDKELDLVGVYLNWLENSTGLEPGEAKELKAALENYNLSADALGEAVRAYLHAEDNGNTLDAEGRLQMLGEIDTALTQFQRDLLALEQVVSDTLVETAGQIGADVRTKAKALGDLAEEKGPNLIAKGAEVGVEALRSLSKLGEEFSLLKSIYNENKDLFTPEAAKALLAEIKNIQAIFNKTPAGTGQTPVSTATETPSTAAQNKAMDNGTQKPAASSVASSAGAKYNTAYVSQLENAMKIVAKKPGLKSVKSKARKVTVKWSPVKAGKISYYQVYYKLEGKKAVVKKITKFKAKAKSISYTTGKLKKGQNCTVKVRGVYKGTMSASGKAAKKLYYTQWSKARIIKVK